MLEASGNSILELLSFWQSKLDKVGDAADDEDTFRLLLRASVWANRTDLVLLEMRSCDSESMTSN